MIPLDITGVSLEMAIRQILKENFPAENCSIFSDAEKVQEIRYVGFLVRAEAPDTEIKNEDGTPALSTYPITITYLTDTREAAQLIASAVGSLGGIFSMHSMRSALEKLPDPFSKCAIVRTDSMNGSMSETAGKRFDFSIQINAQCFPLLAANDTEV